MSQQMGITLGIPIMSAIATAVAHGSEEPAAVLDGVTTAIAVNAGLCVLGAVLTAAFLPRRAVPA